MVLQSFFRNAWILITPGKNSGPTFQCIIVLQPRGQCPNYCWNFMYPKSLWVHFDQWAKTLLKKCSAVGAEPFSAVRPICRLFDEYFISAVTFTAKFETLGLKLI